MKQVLAWFTANRLSSVVCLIDPYSNITQYLNYFDAKGAFLDSLQLICFDMFIDEYWSFKYPTSVIFNLLYCKVLLLVFSCLWEHEKASQIKRFIVIFYYCCCYYLLIYTQTSMHTIAFTSYMSSTDSLYCCHNTANQLFQTCFVSAAFFFFCWKVFPRFKRWEAFSFIIL